jgi:DNA processing protein
MARERTMHPSGRAPVSPVVDDEATAMLTLARADGVGPVRASVLLEAFGRAVAVVEAGLAGRWPPLPGWDATRSRAAGRSVDPAAAARERERGLRLGARLVTLGDAAYPRPWRAADRWPLALWVRGAWPAPLLGSLPAGLAVVGPRRATPEACAFARDTAAAACWAGAWVVSGLAYGIDAAAHAGAVAAARGGAAASTIGVLAGGVDRVHPSTHRDLARALLDAGGGLVAAAPIGGVPAAGAFPVRNRWIAGLSGAVAVVEAGARSGALHTAAAALELGREVRTTPARPWDEHAAGSLALLRDGAAPLLTPEDGWRSLPAGTLAVAASVPDRSAPKPPPPWDRLLPGGPRHPDAWAEAAAIPIGAVLAALEVGVLEGWATRRPDGRYGAPGADGGGPRVAAP